MFLIVLYLEQKLFKTFGTFNICIRQQKQQQKQNREEKVG
jgi:hypothetical protein